MLKKYWEIEGKPTKAAKQVLETIPAGNTDSDLMEEPTFCDPNAEACSCEICELEEVN